MQESLKDIIALINSKVKDIDNFLSTFIEIINLNKKIDDTINNIIDMLDTLDNKNLVAICFSIILNLEININRLNYILHFNHIGFNKIKNTSELLELTPLEIYSPNFYEYINKGFCPNINTLYNIIPNITNDIPIYETPELVNIIRDIIEIWNVVPDKVVLDKLMLLQNIDLIKLVISYKVEPDINTFKTLINNNDMLIASNCYPHLKYDEYISNFSQIIELILVYIPLTFDMLIDIFPIYQIKDLERFNILYDDKLYSVCHYYQIFPEHYMNKFPNKEQLSFRHLFYNNNIEIINAFPQIGIDQYCYNNAILGNNYELLNNYEYYGTGFEAKITLYAILGNPVLNIKKSIYTSVPKIDVLENIINKNAKSVYKIRFNSNFSYKQVKIEYDEKIDIIIDPNYKKIMSSISHNIHHYKTAVNIKKYNKLINYKNKIKLINALH